MIFITLGTHEQRFDRLLQMVDRLQMDQECVVQYGFSTYHFEKCKAVPFIEFGEMCRLMARADAIVTHAGVGSIMLALSSGKRPVVAPRLHRFGEHVDDHQVEIAEAFARSGKVTMLLPGNDLADKIVEAGRGSLAHTLKPSQRLVDFLNTAISAAPRVSEHRASR